MRHVIPFILFFVLIGCKPSPHALGIYAGSFEYCTNSTADVSAIYHNHYGNLDRVDFDITVKDAYYEALWIGPRRYGVTCRQVVKRISNLLM